MPDKENDLEHQAARLYAEGLNNEQIAERLGIKDTRRIRPLLEKELARLLKRSRDAAIYEATAEPSIYDNDLSAAVKSKFPFLLSCDVTLPDNETQSLRLEAFAVKYFRLLERLNQHNDPVVTALSGGETFQALQVIRQRLPMSNIYFCPAAVFGQTVMFPHAYMAPEVCTWMAWYLAGCVPGRLGYSTRSASVVPRGLKSSQIRQLLLEDTVAESNNEIVEGQLKLLRSARFVVGSLSVPVYWDADTPPHNLLTPFDVLDVYGVDTNALVRDGLAGEFGLCLFDDDGNGREEWNFWLSAGYPNSTEFYRQLAKKELVLATGSQLTVRAIKAALRGRLINLLVVDRDTAQELLKD